MAEMIMTIKFFEMKYDRDEAYNGFDPG